MCTFGNVYAGYNIQGSKIKNLKGKGRASQSILAMNEFLFHRKLFTENKMSTNFLNLQNIDFCALAFNFLRILSPFPLKL